MNVSQIKAAVRERDGTRCTECGMTLEVHRLTPGAEYAVDGCVTLCRPCHGPKPRSPRGTARDQKGRRPIRLMLKAHVLEALESFIGAQRFKMSARKVVRLALMEFLTREGFYPLKDKSPGRN